MENIKKYSIWLLLILPSLIVFKNLFDISNPLVWGDAPFFYPENLKELFNVPFAWEIRNSNFGAPQLLTLWLYLPTFLMGLLYWLSAIHSEISIRLIFYIPFILGSIIGPFLILSKFNLNRLEKILGSLFYLLNTYSLVLLDGGQIGVLLSYGIFPLAFYSYINLENTPSIKRYFSATLFHFIIFNIDLRIALILVLFEVLWIFAISPKKLSLPIKILPVYLITIMASLFWIVPFLQGLSNKSTESGIQSSRNFITLENSFYLFQPHFPANDFGNLSKTPVYFIFFIFILIVTLLIKERKVFALFGLYLLFVFLSKGSNPPLGNIYDWALSGIPLAGAFRDSSKFYIPGILVSSILIGFSVDFFRKKFHKLKYLWVGFVYLFILLMIYPAAFGNMTGVLGTAPNKNEYENIHKLIKDGGEFRSLWFPEKPPLGFSDWSHPSLSAALLVKNRPFASMTSGDYDLYGFLHDQNISKWYELFGIKYIFYPPNQRDKTVTEKEKYERVLFENFISKIPGLEKIDSDISFPVYKTSNPAPKIFGQKKVLFSLDNDEIYDNLFSIKNFSLEKIGVISLEDCLFNPEKIFSFKKDSFALLINDPNDLYMTYFCQNFISTEDSKIKEWSINSEGQYLNWKSQLLERGVKNFDHDYGLGLSYSTKQNEKLEFDLNVENPQNYYLPVRFLTATQSAGIKVNLNGQGEILKSETPHKLQWTILGPFKLEKDTKVSFTNLGGLSAINTFGLIAKSEFDKTRHDVDENLKNITTINPKDLSLLNSFVNEDMIPVKFSLINPAEYSLEIPESANWLVFSESYDKKWQLENYLSSSPPVPFYSMNNGYYIADMPLGRAKLYYQPQEKVKLGLTLSIISIFLVCFALILHIIIKRTNYGSHKKITGNFKNKNNNPFSRNNRRNRN